MKKHMMASALLALGLVSGVASAEEPGGVYFGITGGVDQVDIDGVDDGDMFGLTAGYRFGNGMAVEAAFGASEFDNGGCTIELDTMALYGAFRSSGTVYFKGRIGFLSEDVTNDCGLSSSDTGLSLGAGIGARLGPVGIEAEYTLIEQDVNRISISALYNF